MSRFPTRYLRSNVSNISILNIRQSTQLRLQYQQHDVRSVKSSASFCRPTCRGLCYTLPQTSISARIHPARLQHTAAPSGAEKINSPVESVEAPQPPLAIVFTDIVKSTAIWEKDESAMRQAMTIHDDLIRQLTKTYGGYEVKQNGDGFMIAFQHAIPALKFCLDVQVQLQDQDWPKELLELGPASPVVQETGEKNEDGSQETVLWKGLRLRISAHFGEPLCNWNEVIQRMDYLGPAVNRAARYVSVCEGGQIVVGQEFLDELKVVKKPTVGSDGPLFNDAQSTDTPFQDFDLKELHSVETSNETVSDVSDTRFEILELGERNFKGVSEKQKLFVIMPKSLHGRLDYFPRQMYVQPSKGNLIEDG